MGKFKINTTTYIERGVFEMEINVEAWYITETKSYFNGMTGDGHPGDPAEIEIISVKYLGKEIELTSEEEDKVIEFVLESEADNDDCPEWDENDDDR